MVTNGADFSTQILNTADRRRPKDGAVKPTKSDTIELIQLKVDKIIKTALLILIFRYERNNHRIP